ncbi:hypothetical protein G7077_05155 [Sphingomonas piscis]|uniref:DUF2059 domain-containing protein n=1 Tax=Sphingomonas piscis TaxID=2714943 RepID=A0A6G7YNR1_9SPHN|nr:hypothetical protein [Sphingomonas piscis]QIK78385.1 hypothetical protein G7077_05155 [Sphingomonas piscis]
MRSLFAFALLGVAAAPAAAQPAVPDATEIQRALNDPAITDQLTRVLPALGDALLNMPVGPLQAAIEGRPATRADQRTTVRDLGRRRDPNFDRKLKADLANSGETMKAGMKAMSTALPAIVEGLQKAAAEVEKATANLPSPTYPKR